MAKNMLLRETHAIVLTALRPYHSLRSQSALNDLLDKSIMAEVPSSSGRWKSGFVCRRVVRSTYRRSREKQSSGSNLEKVKVSLSSGISPSLLGRCSCGRFPVSCSPAVTTIWVGYVLFVNWRETINGDLTTAQHASGRAYHDAIPGRRTLSFFLVIRSKIRWRDRVLLTKMWEIGHPHELFSWTSFVKPI